MKKYLSLGGILFVVIILTGCSHNVKTVVEELAPESRIDNQAGVSVVDKKTDEFKAPVDLPPSSLTNVNAKKLTLSNSNLKSLPSEIGNLTKVEEFYVDNNFLTGALPAEIRKMTKLKILNASNNQLTGIPAEIGQLKNLETLDLSNNQIDTMPNEIYNIKDNLKTLDLSGNTYSDEKLKEIRAGLPNTEVIY